ncbi:MAG: C4-dicarboxylate TRAP transporter substrate-binding protein [Burkholderiales bacterium]|nr:C4-dicarboxylate TRAP transporter substrate-binding protein [Burkholderiales bacterium]
MRMLGTTTAAAFALSAFAAAPALADTIKLRIATGHPPGVVYAGLMKDFFQTELQKQVESRTKHKIEWVEGYSGSIVKVTETLEGVQNGIVDIGGFCFCFEAAKLPLHAFQVMLPFGTMDPTISLAIAQDVYKAVPYLTSVFEEKYNQKLLARIADGGYNLGTSFDWNKVSDLKGVKIAGAGLNLNWLKYAGVTPVQGSLPEAYTGMKTHVYEGWIMFPSAWVNLKLYEPGPYYTLIGFGSITWHGLTINKASWSRLPKEVQPILLEVARAYEEKTGTNNKERYGQDIEKLRNGLAKVKELDPSVRKEWAESLKDWPQSHADTLKKEGLPVVKTLNTVLDSAEKRGHKWPVRYVVK